MKPLKIGIDLDGCVADWNSAFAKILTTLTGIVFPLTSPTFPEVWDWPQHYGVTKDEMAGAWRVVATTEFWHKLKPLDTPALARIGQLHNAGHDIYFITHRFFGKNVKQQTELWLAKHGVYFPTVLRAVGNKGWLTKGLGLDVFIDDKWENCADAHAAGVDRVYLIDQPYNRHVPEFRRAESVSAVLTKELGEPANV